jgi:hypothetical protein
VSGWDGASVASLERGSSRRLLGLATVLAICAVFALAGLAAIGGASLQAPVGLQAATADGVSALALKEIPARYLALYQAAAARYGLDWSVLAGIGKVECDHGRSPAPSCTQEGQVNGAGAGGPMQFLASTWARYGVPAEGAGPPDRWNAADAIYAAANYLRAAGAPTHYEAAVFAYNHAHWYVAEVMRWASRYRGSAATGDPPLAQSGEGADIALAGQTTTPVRFIPGERARLDPGDGHLALIPTGIPPVVQALLVAGNELQNLPYGPDGHPDPLGATQEDCSSTLNYVLYRAGLRPLAEILRLNPLAQDYVDWGEPGAGRWVSIYAAAAPSAHTFIVIAGIRLDTSHDGTDVGPNRFEDGPRWRILEHIPTWERWSVRHPPGL